MGSYRALSAIKYSDSSDPNAEVVVIEAGELVEGLPTETMKELWNAGALEKVEDPTPEPAAVTTPDVQP